MNNPEIRTFTPYSEFNNGFIIGSLLGLTVVKRFEHAEKIVIADTISGMTAVAVDIPPFYIFTARMTVNTVNLGLAELDMSLTGFPVFRFVGINITDNADISLTAFTPKFIELEVVPT